MPPRGRPKGSVAVYSEPKRPLHPILYALRKKRIEAKISQGDLAERIGYSIVTVEDWEQGRTEPGLRALNDLAQGLGLRVTLEKTDD